jgi:two-component system response regulator MtrA
MTVSLSPKPCRVLVADDDPTVALLMQVALPPPDYSTTVVASGDSALDVFGQQPFDLVLLDVEMPGRDGFEVCREIRRRSGRSVPVLLVTGRNDPEFHSRADELAADHIAKPVDWGGLAALVQRLIRR